MDILERNEKPMIASVREILEAVLNGSMSPTKAEKILRLDALSIIGEVARVDINRQLRRGVPEIIYARGKSKLQLESILEREISESSLKFRPYSPVILSKVRSDQIRFLRMFFRKRRKFLASKGLQTKFEWPSGMVILSEIGEKVKFDGNAGRVALLSAGTSDIAILKEAEIVLEAMRCRTISFNDVGVAALKRLSKPLKEVQRFDPDALIVAAGMEAALPSVIAGLSGVPVIGLPTSAGYGFGGRGEAALMSILQACPLGICAVNIDNGVAAGVIAGLIANRCYEMRKNHSGSQNC